MCDAGVGVGVVAEDVTLARLGMVASPMVGNLWKIMPRATQACLDRNSRSDESLKYTICRSRVSRQTGGTGDAESQGTCYVNASVVGGCHFHRAGQAGLAASVSHIRVCGGGGGAEQRGRGPRVWASFGVALIETSGGRRSPAVACWASDHWVASSNPIRGKFRH